MAGRLKDEIKKRGPFESLEQEVLLNLLRTADALGRDFEAVFKPAGISMTQYNVLRILRGAGEDGLACGEIGDRMITRDPDMTRLLDRLESRGLITRVREATDRRVVKTRITKDGLSLLSKLDDPISATHQKQMEHMDERKLQTLLKLLEEARVKPVA